MYTDDVLILGTKIVPNWWRDEDHTLKKQDLGKIIDYKPDLLIIGKGAYGNMVLSKNLESRLDFDVEKYDTAQAVKVYNKKIKSEKKVAGAFHLTC